MEILKHLTGLSDEKIVARLQTDLEFQYFCGIQNIYEDTDMEPSSMTHFRNRIAEYPEILEEIQKAHLVEAVKKLPKRRQGQYDQDSTVINQSIKYPSDIDLLNDVVQK
jgi:IS5 family transposase